MITKITLATGEKGSRYVSSERRGRKWDSKLRKQINARDGLGIYLHPTSHDLQGEEVNQNKQHAPSLATGNGHTDKTGQNMNKTQPISLGLLSPPACHPERVDDKNPPFSSY